MTLLILFAFSTTCFAKGSPKPTVLPAEESTDNGDGDGGKGDKDGHGKPNTSDKSPKTGNDLGYALVAIISATGIALVSRKKYSEC